LDNPEEMLEKNKKKSRLGLAEQSPTTRQRRPNTSLVVGVGSFPEKARDDAQSACYLESNLHDRIIPVVERRIANASRYPKSIARLFKPRAPSSNCLAASLA
jgi:hypothetical protein